MKTLAKIINNKKLTEQNKLILTLIKFLNDGKIILNEKFYNNIEKYKTKAIDNNDITSIELLELIDKRLENYDKLSKINQQSIILNMVN